MGAQDNAAALQAFNDAFNARDVDKAIALCTPDVELLNIATGATFRGPDGVRQFFQVWATAFPDSKVTTRTLTASDTTAVMEFTGYGTQTGPLVGPQGTIPPTGRVGDTMFVSICEMSGGKIARSRLYFDLGSLLAQLGVVPAPAQVQAGGQTASGFAQA